MDNFKEIANKCINGELSGKFIILDKYEDIKYILPSTSITYDPYCHDYYELSCKGITPYIDNDAGLCTVDSDGESLHTTFKVIDFIPDTDMKQNELTIEIPSDKIVDWDESKKQNKIILIDKQLTYGDITRNTLITNISNLHYFSEHQLECILAKNKLANVAKYLNGEWEPQSGTNGYSLHMIDSDILPIYLSMDINYGLVFFKTRELAQQAIEILGEETVKLALEPLGI